MSDCTSREAEIFTEALRLPPAERAAYLNQACREDAGLRQRIENLLQAQERMGRFLEQTGQASEMNQVAAAASDGASGRVGRYRLVEKLGEGGCGVVYLAEQDEPVRRQVALKIIKPGMDTREVIARFEAERQALALMDHPGIAKVFDAGETEAGRPYFVMELIRGRKITDYCDEHALATEERLGLFVRVCQAIQHAHQKGIIHRDIKPSNILVTTAADGTRQPVVIDFGIAKATVGVQLTDKTLFTAVDMLIGTPTYMSPEQTAVSSADVDTRSDIYSLGVLLYELLTGTTPFDAGDLLRLGVDEVRRAIRESEPPLPSARLGGMTGDTLAGVAKHRQAEPRTLIRSVRGDLDWIAMKALEKDRARRYETANGLALDVRRYLADETVSARPASVGYRLQKTVRRHKVLFAGAGTLAVLLVVSLVAIASSLAKEKQARHEAELARQQAETDRAKSESEAARSQQVTKFLQDLLQGVGPSVALGRDTTMLREILEKAAARIEKELGGQPLVAADLQIRVAAVYTELAAFEQSEALIRTALATYRKVAGNESKEVASTLVSLGDLLIERDQPGKAAEVMRDALALWRKNVGNEHAEVARTLSRLATAMMNEGKIAEAEPLHREALAIRRKIFGDEHPIVTSTLSSLAQTLLGQHRYVEVEKIQREVLARRRKQYPVWHPERGYAVQNLAWTMSQLSKDGRDLDEIEALMREEVAMLRKVYGQEHPEVSDGLALLAVVLRKEGEFPEAEAAVREGWAIARKVLGEEHRKTLWAQELLSTVLVDQGRLAEAETVLRVALEVHKRKLGADHFFVATQLANLAEICLRQDNLAEAELNYRRAVAIHRKLPGPPNPIRAEILAGLGAVLHRKGEYPEGEAVLREASAIEHEAFAVGDWRRVRVMDKLQAILKSQGKMTEVEAIQAELEAAKKMVVDAGGALRMGIRVFYEQTTH